MESRALPFSIIDIYISHSIPVADLPYYLLLLNISNIATRVFSLRLHGWLLYLGLVSRPLNPSSGRGSVYCRASEQRLCACSSTKIRILRKAGGSGLRRRRCVDATVWRSSGSPQSGMGCRRDLGCRCRTRRRICLVGERWDT